MINDPREAVILDALRTHGPLTQHAMVDACGFTSADEHDLYGIIRRMERWGSIKGVVLKSCVKIYALPGQDLSGRVPTPTRPGNGRLCATILHILSIDPCTTADAMVRLTGYTKPYIHMHMRHLREAGLVVRTTPQHSHVIDRTVVGPVPAGPPFRRRGVA